MRLLDLFCGAGGAAMGYHRAGFDEIVGVDIKPQPRYPFHFVQADALEFCASFGAGFDAIHASPPCKAFTIARHKNKVSHDDLLTPARAMLKLFGVKPYVIENVPGAPMGHSALICGLAFGLTIKRHRLFESNIHLFGTECPLVHDGEWYTVFGDGGRPNKPRAASGALARQSMGIEWMNRNELSQAIPPAYTEFIGRQLLEALK